MAEGDYELTTGELSSGAQTTITVPSGDVWVVRAIGSESNDVGLDFTDGTNQGRMLSAADPRLVAQRPVFDDTIDPVMRNTNGSNARDFYFAAHEIADEQIVEAQDLASQSESTITVPGGEKWVISAVGGEDNSAQLRADDGTNNAMRVVNAGSGADDMANGPLFNDSVDPRIRNSDGSNAKFIYFGGIKV